MSASLDDVLKRFGKTYYVFFSRKHTNTNLSKIANEKTAIEILNMNTETIPQAIFPPDDEMTDAFSNNWPPVDRVKYLAIKALGKMKRDDQMTTTVQRNQNI